MTDASLTEAVDALEPVDAYSLLTRPTLDLTDAEVDIVIADLQARRARHLQTGKPDKPKAERAAKAVKPDAAAKAKATADLLASLEWKL